jgi:folate-binding protein YgfZ
VSEIAGVPAETLGGLAPYSHVAGAVDDTAVEVVRTPDLELEGYELLVPAAAYPALWQRAIAAGAVPGGLLAWEIARIEAGRPEWGLDIDETTIPQEANFDELHAISYTKGCYVGQEVVARVHFRGHVNRHLRGIRLGEHEPPPDRTPLLDASGKQVGEVRSSALSPRLGGIALAMVRREVGPATVLHAQLPNGDVEGELLALPFPLE